MDRSIRMTAAAVLLAGTTAASEVPGAGGSVSARAAIGTATLAESGAVTPEIGTDDLVGLLEAGTTPVIDVRSAREYAIAHIPGAVNVWEKEVEGIAQKYPDPAAPLVLYCNGPFCGKSRRVSADLVKRGYTAVRRYQLGLPVWRALGHTVQTDIEGLRYVIEGDRTAIFVDARAQGDPLPGAVVIRPGEAEAANEDGRLPHRDKGTRVIVFGSTPAEARTVAEQIARKAYWNSSYFGGAAEEARLPLVGRTRP